MVKLCVFGPLDASFYSAYIMIICLVANFEFRVMLFTQKYGIIPEGKLNVLVI